MTLEGWGKEEENLDAAATVEFFPKRWHAGVLLFWLFNCCGLDWSVSFPRGLVPIPIQPG